MSKALTVLDLFCGCGGMSWGLTQMGFDVRAGVDFNKPALATYRANMPKAKAHFADLATVSPQDCLAELGIEPGLIDVLVGGPPCQGFSKNVPRSNRYLDDPKNLLVRAFLAFIPVLQPKCIVMENVAEMYNAFDGAFSTELRERLVEWGYSSAARVHDAADFGVPQRRRRVLFLAAKGQHDIEFPVGTHVDSENSTPLFRGRGPVTVWDAIGDLAPVLAEKAQPDAYRSEPTSEFQRVMRAAPSTLTEHTLRKLKATQQARYDSIQPGQGLRELPDHLRPKSGYSGAYGRLTRDMVAPTITRWVFHPGSGRWGHPDEPRLMTIREVARIQSFSDDFVFKGTNIEKSHQLGNAVPPLLMHAIAPIIRRLVGGVVTSTERSSQGSDPAKARGRSSVV